MSGGICPSRGDSIVAEELREDKVDVESVKEFAVNSEDNDDIEGLDRCGVVEWQVMLSLLPGS